LSDVRQAAAEAGSMEPALEFAAGALGRAGADLLYDLFRSERANTSSATLVAKTKALVESDSVRAKASPALLITLDLQRAKSCKQYKDLLPRVSEHADDRALAHLRKLTQRRGCGFLGLGDCYECLRRGNALAEAIAAAESRKAPSYLNGPTGAAQSDATQ
jgi:hypothetical protein